MPEKVRGVTSFLESDHEILILLRSRSVSTYSETWGGVSGAIDAGKTPLDQAVLEITEETGLSERDVMLVKEGPALVFCDDRIGVTKEVYPFLFHVEDRKKIRIDWEHTKIKWINPVDVDKYPAMPKLKEMLSLVLKI
jgi:8-oxo-dGTP pyrophosphatase MutT (NUDIX family)